MKAIKLYLVAALLVTAVTVTSFKKAEPVKGFAVVELFTSEGCSSCPPADALVAKLEKESAGKSIYILAYHVDYWNHLGWKDAFSDAAYSARQKDYAKYLHIEGIYTPQIVVNGKTEFVGSEEGTLHKAVASALQKEPNGQLLLKNSEISRDIVQVNYEASNAGDHSILLLALVKKSAQSHIKSGENNGRTLTHVQIVEKLVAVTMGQNKKGSERIKLPNDFDRSNWEVVGFVQNKFTGEIIGASKADFAKE